MVTQLVSDEKSPCVPPNEDFINTVPFRHGKEWGGVEATSKGSNRRYS